MDNKVRLILVIIDISIPFEVGVKQGDSVAPVLFIFVMMTFSETLEKEWVRNGLQMIKLKRQSNSPLSSGRITSHPAKIFSHGTLFKTIVCSMLTMEHLPLRQENIWNGNRVQSCFQTLQPFWVANAHQLQVKTLQDIMRFYPCPWSL